MNDKTVIIWILFAGIFAACALWQVHENRQLSRRWYEMLDIGLAHSLTRFAWSRSLQLLAVLAACMVIVGLYDWQLNMARKAANPPAPEAHKDAALPPPVTKSPEVPVTTAAPAPAPTPAPAAAPVAVASSPPVPQALPVVPGSIDDLYNPEKRKTDAQSEMDGIKKRYEEILVTYMFLHKCGKSGPDDYHIITSALAQEMAAVHAPGKLQYDILASAQGSYKEMYARSPCSQSGVNALYAQYDSYIKAISPNTR